MDSRGGEGERDAKRRWGPGERERVRWRERRGDRRERERDAHRGGGGGNAGCVRGGCEREKMLGKVGAGRGVRKTAK